MSRYDYIIVGQGLAGTLLSYQLIKKNKKILVIDNGNPNAASQIAAGIINPITGRKFNKSWMIDELLPVAKDLYREMEELLNWKIYYDVDIIRSMHSIKEENDWSAKTSLESNQKYVKEEYHLGDYSENTKTSLGYGELKNCARIDSKLLVLEFRAWLQKKEAYFQENFDSSKLSICDDSVRYGDAEAKKIVFCEGWRVLQNPYFDYLPFDPAKGEILILDIPNIDSKKLLKNKLFFVPLGERKFWVGATYEWDTPDEKPTEVKKEQLLEKVESVLETEWTLLDHQAAIRPTTKIRRPFFGQHPKFASLYIFNGFGTKGYSIGPYWSQRFVQYLEEDVALGDEVDIDKYAGGYIST